MPATGGHTDSTGVTTIAASLLQDGATRAVVKVAMATSEYEDAGITNNVTGVTPHVMDSYDRGGRDVTKLADVSVSVIIVAVIMAAVTVISLISNAAVLAVILRTNLRWHFTYVFVNNVCIMDIGACVLVQPIAIQAYIDDGAMAQWICELGQFCFVLFSLASIYGQCLVSFERFYSIWSPMHYSAHMTLTKVALLIAANWAIAAGFAAASVARWPERSDVYVASPIEVSDLPDRLWYDSVTCAMFYVLPAIFIATMYYLIYTVAKRAASQVQPSNQGTHISAQTVTSATSSTVSSPTSVITTVHCNCITTAGLTSASCHPGVRLGLCLKCHGQLKMNAAHSKAQLTQLFSAPNSNPVSTSPPISIPIIVTPSSSVSVTFPTVLPSTSNSKHVDHLKTIRVLSLIIIAFLSLWSVKFLSTLTSSGVPAAVAQTGLWTACLSFGTNSIFYGWMNRSVRDAAGTVLSEVKDWLSPSNPANNLSPRANESFFEFLDRTSTPPQRHDCTLNNSS
jgi:hypothetical protein